MTDGERRRLRAVANREVERGLVLFSRSVCSAIDGRENQCGDARRELAASWQCQRKALGQWAAAGAVAARTATSSIPRKPDALPRHTPFGLSRIAPRTSSSSALPRGQRNTRPASVDAQTVKNRVEAGRCHRADKLSARARRAGGDDAQRQSAREPAAEWAGSGSGATADGRSSSAHATGDAVVHATVQEQACDAWHSDVRRRRERGAWPHRAGSNDLRQVSARPSYAAHARDLLTSVSTKPALSPMLEVM